MTNNDELALKLSELARKAVPGPWGIARDGLTVVSNQSHPVAKVSDAEHRMLSDLSTGMDAEFIATANPANILALLAERDAKDARIAELEARLVEYARIATENAHRIAELEREKEAMTAVALAMRDDMRDARSLLEARTVSVKFPRYDLDMSDCDSCGQDCGADMSEEPDGDYVLLADVVAKLAAAGIKLDVGE